MTKIIPMRKALISLLLSCFAAVPVFATIERTGLKAAMDKGLVTVKAVSTAHGYHKMKLQVQNTTGKALQVTIDPGLIFRPDDTSYQDLVLPGGDLLVLTGRREETLELNSFCAKSYAASPVKELRYIFNRQADSGLVKLLTFIRKNQLYDDLGQSAVWVMTNDHDLNGAFDPERAAISEQLLALLSQVTHRPVPDHYKHYAVNNTPGEPAFVPKVVSVYARFEWKQEAPKIMTLGVYNEAGELIKPIAESQEFARGDNRVTIELEAKNVKAGKYYIRLMDGKTVLKEKLMVVD